MRKRTRKENLKAKIARERPLRMHLTYHVEYWAETRDEYRADRELPFVIRVIGDYAGNPEGSLPAFKNRKFIEIDDDNFNPVMEQCMKPRLVYSVENKLKNDGSKLEIELKFNAIEDFEPDKLVEKIEPLRKLVDARRKLADLCIMIKGNEKLGNILRDVIGDPHKLKVLRNDLDNDGDLLMTGTFENLLGIVQELMLTPSVARQHLPSLISAASEISADDWASIWFPVTVSLALSKQGQPTWILSYELPTNYWDSSLPVPLRSCSGDTFVAKPDSAT
jgi:type VI secretion system protein ImpB